MSVRIFIFLFLQMFIFDALSQVDPLNYVFKPLKSSETLEGLKAKSDFNYFVGFYKEGINLKNYCENDHKVIYKSLWTKEQALRSILATYQYVGLDILIRALAQYAKDFEFTREEYNNFVNNLIGSNCSKNITVISLKQLKLNMLKIFDNDSSYSLPSIKTSNFYPDKLKQIENSKNGKKNEFAMTLNLFESVCSWGNDVDNYRLIVPLLQDPFISSFIFRQMSGVKINWDYIEDKILLVNDKDSVKIACDGLICRKRNAKDFRRLFPKMLGSTSIMDDLKKIYCEEFKDSTYQVNDQVPSIKKIIDSRLLDEEKFMRSHMISLITGVPDFLLNSGKFSDGVQILRASTDATWDRWSNDLLSRYTKELMYEESLRVEKVDRKYYYQNKKPNFKVVMDVNLGELDRSDIMNNKIKAEFSLTISKEFLSWIRTEWGLKKGYKKEREALIEKFKAQIEMQITEKKKKFIIPPWEGDLSRIISMELMDQLTDYIGEYFKNDVKSSVEIPIEFRYGVFALKYIRYRYNNRNNEVEI